MGGDVRRKNIKYYIKFYSSSIHLYIFYIQFVLNYTIPHAIQVLIAYNNPIPNYEHIVVLNGIRVLIIFTIETAFPHSTSPNPIPNYHPKTITVESKLI